jgi:hypothetical protein
MIIVIFSLSISGSNLHWPIFAETNHDKFVNLKDIKNFSFLYRQYSGRFYPDQVSISYSSDHKEILYKDSRQSVYLTRPVSNREDLDLKKIVSDNEFLQKPNDLRIKCCNLTVSNLTVTINNKTHSSLWNIDAPIEIYKIAYAINHLANFTESTIDNGTALMTKGIHSTREYNDTNFSFDYTLSDNGIHGIYNKIIYNSNTKELIVNCNASTLLVKSLCGPGNLGTSHVRILDNLEEANLKQLINNNGFFNSVFPESPNCSNCYVETLTIKLDDATRTIRWNVTQGVVIPYAIFDTLRVINYVASK